MYYGIELARTGKAGLFRKTGPARRLFFRASKVRWGSARERCVPGERALVPEAEAAGKSPCLGPGFVASFEASFATSPHAV